MNGSDLWIGTYSNGVIRMNLASGRMKQYTEKDGLDSKSCYAIYKDHLGVCGFRQWDMGFSFMTGNGMAFIRFIRRMRLFSILMKTVGVICGSLLRVLVYIVIIRLPEDGKITGV
jgi:hypothetical protein